MVKKEVSEIKKQFTPTNACILRICGCYVDPEKQEKMRMKEPFFKLDEEEIFKYFELFKKVLSGKIGKTLLNLEFPLEEEKSGSCHPLLMKLTDTQLDDDEALSEFYERVAENYLISDGCGYMILLAFCRYDIPGKGEDGADMFDASDEVYSFIIGAVCPFKLSKPGLSYKSENNRLENNERAMMVEMPAHGFLFPAFNERTTDIHEMLYYTKAAEGPQEDFVKAVFGCRRWMTPGEQKDAFQLICEELNGGTLEYGLAKTLNENLLEVMEEKSYGRGEDPLSAGELRKILEESGMKEEKLEKFEEAYRSFVKDGEGLSVSNLVDGDKFQIEAQDISIRTTPDSAGNVKVRMIDGRPCIVIELNGDVEVNGVAVNMLPETK